MSENTSTTPSPIPTPVPPPSRLLARVLNPVYRFFDWLYGSEFNPLYRSGTLAVGFLLVLLITGLYLCFFYSISQPYESLVALQEQKWLGRWVRTLHRYATVATVIAILFHILQLLAQGKCWGPRTLAWVSGIILTGLFFLSAWSGYVMVWDRHGQRVVMAGSELLSAFPVLRDVVSAAFDGTAEIPPGFFFMNLFLHVALPLVMIIMLWVHTARLSRAVWFPRRKILWWSIGGLFLLSVVWPAPLLEKANLLKLIDRMPTDISTGFWMSGVVQVGAPMALSILAILAILLTSIPWWWRPRRGEQREISRVDIEACTGCTQCTRDCPYEAIKMVPRSDGKRLVAEIIPNHCVSCGICAASCADFAIGPPGRSAVDQRTRVADFCSGFTAHSSSLDLILVTCANNPGLGELVERYKREHARTEVYPVECCGCMHSEVIEQLLGISKGCALIGCPARNCFNRDGGELLAERIFEKRVPFLDRSIDRNRLSIAAYSEAEGGHVWSSLEEFRERLKNGASAFPEARPLLANIRAAVASIILLAFCAYMAQIPNGHDPQHALVRVAGTLSASETVHCRKPNAAEIAALPLHMRPNEICERNAVSYLVTVSANGRTILKEEVKQEAGRIDVPLFLDLETAIPVGQQDLIVSISSLNLPEVRCQATVALGAGDIYLAHFKRIENQLICPKSSGASAEQ